MSVTILNNLPDNHPLKCTRISSVSTPGHPAAPDPGDERHDDQRKCESEVTPEQSTETGPDVGG